MIKIFKPKPKGRVKTNARGFWRSDTGKVYYDYIDILSVDYIYGFNLYNCLDEFKCIYQQECIFYVKNNIGYVYYSRDRIEELSQKIDSRIYKWRIDCHKGLKALIKDYLSCYGGVTIIDKGDYYLFEAYTKGI